LRHVFGGFLKSCTRDHQAVIISLNLVNQLSRADVITVGIPLLSGAVLWMGISFCNPEHQADFYAGKTYRRVDGH